MINDRNIPSDDRSNGLHRWVVEDERAKLRSLRKLRANMRNVWRSLLVLDRPVSQELSTWSLKELHQASQQILRLETREAE